VGSLSHSLIFWDKDLRKKKEEGKREWLKPRRTRVKKRIEAKATSMNVNVGLRHHTKGKEGELENLGGQENCGGSAQASLSGDGGEEWEKRKKRDIGH